MLSVNFAHMISRDFISKLLIWRIKHIKNPTFVIILSVVIGVLAGLAAVVLKGTVHYIQYFLKSGFLPNYTYFLYPLIGIVLTVIISRYIFNAE